MLCNSFSFYQSIMSLKMLDTTINHIYIAFFYRLCVSLSLCFLVCFFHLSRFFFSTHATGSLLTRTAYIFSHILFFLFPFCTVYMNGFFGIFKIFCKMTYVDLFNEESSLSLKLLFSLTISCDRYHGYE